VLVSKYCDHTPLYRQAQIYARHGMELTTEHDAAGLLCRVGQQKPVPNIEISALLIAGRRDGFWTKIAIPTRNRTASVKHDERHASRRFGARRSTVDGRSVSEEGV
jgi:hypothetical protein